MYILFYLQQEKFGLAQLGNCILKMALFYSFRNGQVDGESHKETDLCIMSLLSLCNHPHFDMAILVGLCHFHFFISFPKSCVQVIPCAIVEKKKKKPTFQIGAGVSSHFSLLGVYFQIFCFFKLMPKRKNIIICKLNYMSCILLAQQLEPLSLQVQDCCYSTKKKMLYVL